MNIKKTQNDITVSDIDITVHDIDIILSGTKTDIDNIAVAQ